MRSVLIAVATLFVVQVHAGTVTDRRTIASKADPVQSNKDSMDFGNWRIVRKVNSMTDEVECNAFYRTDNRFQASRSGLFISVSGGLRGYQIRFGDDPAEPLALASRIEENINVVIISGERFEHAQKTTRVRANLVTYVRDSPQVDFDSTGLGTAVAYMNANCSK